MALAIRAKITRSNYYAVRFFLRAILFKRKWSEHNDDSDGSKRIDEKIRYFIQTNYNLLL